MITFRAEHSLEDVTISELLEQIAVTQPYFAFSQIHQSAAGKLVAVVPSLEHLAFPDETLHLIVQHKVSDTAAGRHGFRCRALAEGRKQHLFGEMFLTLQVVPPSVGIRPNGSPPRMPR